LITAVKALRGTGGVSDGNSKGSTDELFHFDMTLLIIIKFTLIMN